MKKYWSAKARSLAPYVPGEQPRSRVIKLNTNENAYPPSPEVEKSVISASKNLRLYPPADAYPLRAAAAEYNGVALNQVFCSNGSDEALALCFTAFFDPEHELKTLDITYSFYPVWAQLNGITLTITPLRQDFTVDVDALCGSYNVVFPNPNAPTGTALLLTDIERIVSTASGVVVVDEAYASFGAQSAVPLLSKYENLVIVRTLSKSHGLAGLRAAYALANPNLIAALNAVKDSFNSYPVDRLAQAGAAAALKDTEYYRRTSENIVNTRNKTIDELRAMGLEVLNSSANFIFIKVGDAPYVLEKLREKGILVRHFSGDRTREYIRVTIGDDGQMREFLSAMKGII